MRIKRGHVTRETPEHNTFWDLSRRAILLAVINLCTKFGVPNRGSSCRPLNLKNGHVTMTVPFLYRWFIVYIS